MACTLSFSYRGTRLSSGKGSDSTFFRGPRASRPIVVPRSVGNKGSFEAAIAARRVFTQAQRRPTPNAAPQPSSDVFHCDFLVLGSGIAGLTYALKVAEYGKVVIITKDMASEGSTQYAQGGVCAVLDQTDSVADHVEDTIVAGAYLNDQQAVEVVCREGPARVLELVQLGARFTQNKDGSLHLTKEGGHNNRRIVHAADATGKEIERALLEQAANHPNVKMLEHHLAVDLVTDEVAGVVHCFGADVLDQRSMTMTRFVSLATMMATGGAGQVYPNTTNPHVSTGDGMAMAYRAGARVSNMEFVQFHPTALYTPDSQGRIFLITEALRGEGAQLFNSRNERFMSQYDDRLELAPRDVVSRAIHDQMKLTGSEHVWLDISHQPRATVLSHFPNIARTCAEHGIDITRDSIPVLPAQHYMCGGVQTGLLGETAVQGLYACGEVSCTGLHGANRLASNSLLEGLVFGDRAVNPSVAHAEYALRNCQRHITHAAASVDFSGSSSAAKLPAPVDAWVARQRALLQDTMWQFAGIVRRSVELRRAREVVSSVYHEARSARLAYGISTAVVELQNLAAVADMVVACALMRKESRGLHYSADYPNASESERRPSVLYPASVPRLGSSLPSYTVPMQTAGGQLLQGNKRKKNSGTRERDLSVRSTPTDQ